MTDSPEEAVTKFLAAASAEPMPAEVALRLQVIIRNEVANRDALEGGSWKRGKPKPTELKGEARLKAPETFDI